MLVQLAYRMLTTTSPRGLWKFAWNFGAKSLLAVERHKRRVKRGQHFPPFLFISVTNQCNLRCQGCWAVIDGPRHSMSAQDLDHVITQGKKHGSSFFGILGGEPLMYDPLWDVLGRHGDCYFQLFTNGTLLTAPAARRMRELGNVTPLVSIEGLEAVSDQRRGGADVYRRTLEGLEHCRENRLITGVATSICQSNIDELVTDRFVSEVLRRGVHYLWYYAYRPSGPNPAPELALRPEQLQRLRRFIVDTRTRVPLILVDAYWDAQGRGLCPAAAGISHHINPYGDVEPCPPIQFALDSALGEGDLFDRLNQSAFLREFRELAARTTRGCILLERPDLLREFLLRSGARDTSGRGTALAELAAMSSHPSHSLPGREIPETSWMYRFAKKHWFFGFGAYG